MTAFNYHLGATRVNEDQHHIVIHAQRAVTVAIPPGGKTWPALSLDEAGPFTLSARLSMARTAACCERGRGLDAAARVRVSSSR